ncbi:MAG: hypothetical protein U0Q18_20360 [Bryobacteraceae bacterium]
MRISGLTLLVIFAKLVPAMQGSDSYTVCEILAENPTRLNGHRLRITGLLEGGDEGAWVDGECTSALTTYGVTWPNIIWLDFNPDNLRAQAAWKRMSEKLAKLHATVRDNIRVTILGKFETRESMRDAVVTGPNGRPRKAGFGHMGTAPATMEVLDITDVIVTKKARIKENTRP